MKKNYVFAFLYLGLRCSIAFAQNSEVRKQEINSDNHTPTFVEFNKRGKKAESNSRQVIKDFLKAGGNIDFQVVKKDQDNLGFSHISHQQFFKGIKVENGIYVTHSRNRQIETMNGNYIPVDADFNITPYLSEQSALKYAIQSVNAKEYMWETEDAADYYTKSNGKYAPKGELVIVEDFNASKEDEKIIPHLAYKFDIYATEPLGRTYIYTDAITGKTLLANAILHHTSATGSLATRYSGSLSAKTDLSANTYKLRDYTRGKGIETYNLAKKTVYKRATDFSDADNNWSSPEYHNANKDDAAFDVHLGLQNTYDYFKNVLGRNSYDNANGIMKAYVHYSSKYVNAFWDGSKMTYGDGDGISYDPLTSQDVTSHELGHGVCQFTANLVYSKESGALNEGFSDIWGACVEYAYFPTKKTWYVGDDFDLVNHKGFRNMANPNEFSDPDTYKGAYWYTGTADNGGVHTNSGVINYCFYLLTVGGSGTNDIGNAFDVTGINITNAAKIFYRAESVYMTSSTNYAGARTACIQASKDLFGAGSQQEKSTTNAFYAVGVGPAYPTPIAPIILSQTSLQNNLVNNNDNVASYTAYPNPAMDFIHLQINSKSESTLEVMLVDMLGRIQFQKTYKAGIGNSEISMDIQQLSKGQYLLRVIDLSNPEETKGKISNIVIR